MTDLSSNLFGSFSGVLKPFKWLTLSSTNTFTLLNQNVNDYQDCRTFSGNNFDNYESFGTLKVTDLRSWSFLTSNLLRLKHSFGEHSLNGLVGQEWYERHRRSSELQMYDQNTPGERNVGGFAHQGTKRDQSTIPTGDEAESASFSVFSEVNYNYAGKYMASASFRTDGSTNFGKNNRYGIFWALSASWLVSQERFMEKQHVFSNLKARFSYGTSGKEAGADYLNYTLYRTGMTTFDYYWNHPAYQSTYAAELNQLGNDNLSWETAHNLNIGVDMGFLGNRIALSADWYRRLSTDLIMQVTLPVAYGVGTQYQNVGEMLNRGVELVLNTHNVKSQDFNWRSTFTFSYNDNKLKKLQDSKLDWDGGRTTLYEGDNIDVLKLVKYAGVDAETGNPLLERVEENGSIKLVNTVYEATSGNEQLSYVDCGLRRAPYWGGFTNTFSYKNWELYVHTTYAFGFKVSDGISREYASGRRWLSSNKRKLPSDLKVWKKAGDHADIPMQSCDQAIRWDLSNGTSFGYVNGSYWKISNIRLSYRFPENWLRALTIQDASLSFTCDNVCSVTSRKFYGIDPENPSGWAAPRRFVFGLNVSF